MLRRDSVIKKIEKAIDILKKATEVLTYILTGYAKTKELAAKISVAFLKVFRVILFIALGGVAAIVVIKVLKKKKNKEIPKAEIEVTATEEESEAEE